MTCKFRFASLVLGLTLLFGVSPTTSHAIEDKIHRGGSGAGDDLSLTSTSHATKGDITFGTSGKTYYEETNDRLNTNSLQFDLTPTDTTAAEGKMVWNVDDGTVNLGMPGGKVNGQMFQEMFVPGRPRNVSGSIMPRGAVVYVSGETGAVPEISLADASTEALSSATIGLAAEDIAINGRGHVITTGLARGITAEPIDTSTFASGALLWLSETKGESTDVKPASPAHAVVVGTVNRVHATEGEILVNVYNGFELYELHDVDDGLSAPTDKQLIAWNGTNSLWEGTPQLFYDFANDRVGVGTAAPATLLEVAGAITITELSSDPSDPAEGEAVFWKGDGTGTGDDGDLLYMEQSAATVATGSLKYKDMVPSSITVNTGTVTGGTGVSDAQVMFDGNLLTIDEVVGVPGFDVEYVFSGVDRVPSFVVVRWTYNGSAIHFVTIDIWNYTDTAWDQLRVFSDSDPYYDSMTMYIPRASNGDYVSSGAAKVRMYHHTSGNNAHDISIDYVGLTHSLQGVF
jgi:hypothetical protein